MEKKMGYALEMAAQKAEKGKEKKKRDEDESRIIRKLIYLLFLRKGGKKWQNQI